MITAKLIVERLDRERRLVERREQVSKSFVKQFFGLLYVAHANLPYTSPYSMTDILGQARNVDVRYQGVPLLIAAPPGDTNIVGYTYYDNMVHIAGNQVGIQVGTGTASPTPTDYALASRIPHSSHVPEVSNSRGEFYLQQATAGEFEFYGATWYCAAFKCLWPHELWRVRLKMYREGSPGAVTIGIRTVRTGADIVTATFDGNVLTTDPAGQWVDIDFATHPQENFLTEYNIVMRAPGGNSTNSIHVICDAASVYGGGYNYYSNNSGVNWSAHYAPNYYMCLFEEWGRDVSKGLEYGGCEVLAPTFAAPNGQFTIRRFFTNVSGDSWTINEAGIYALGTHYSQECWSFLIARDVVIPGVTLLNGELLRVTYVPQITV
jgi:hypothetical protein